MHTIFDCFIYLLGKFVYLQPDWLQRAICVVLANVIWYPPINRRKTILSNLRHSFPGKGREWRKRIGKESCARLIEMGLFVLTSPHFSKAEIQKRFILDPALEKLLEQIEREPTPLVIMVPHFSLMEAITLFPALTERKIPEVGVLYRPLNQASIDGWVKRTRQRWGIRLFSRRDELMDAVNGLRRDGALALLFDQNAGASGAGTLFMGRLCSTTELPGIMAERAPCRVGVLYTERTGIFRARICAEVFDCPRTREAITIEGNRWLECKLRESDNACADWLWAHNRWGHYRVQSCMKPFRCHHDLVAQSLKELGVKEIPDKDCYWITLPEDREKMRALIPVLKAHRQTRPEIHFVALAVDATLAEAKESGIADEVISRTGKSAAFLRAALPPPAVHLVFEAGFRASWEAWRAGALLRVGIPQAWPRLLLNARVGTRSGSPEECYRAFARACGMKEF